MGEMGSEFVVRHCPAALIAVSIEGDVLFWNERAAAMFGYDRGAAIGRTAGE